MLTCPHCKADMVVHEGHTNECYCLSCGWTPTREATEADQKPDPRRPQTSAIHRRLKRKGIGSLVR